MTARRAAAVAACLLMSSAVASAAAAHASDPGTAEWERVPRDRVAAECGMDPDLLEQATPGLTDTPFVVVRYGKLCWEGGYPGGTTDTYSVYSITKTMGGLLTGIVDARSRLSDEDPVTEWIPPEDMGDINPDAKIAHVLAMASTNEDLSAGNKEPWTYDTFGNREIDRLVGVMDRAIAGEPERFAGSADAGELAQRELFDALGMRASSWPGESIAGSMMSSVRDMARMGELVLQRGRYDGRQLLDEDFVYKMTHPSFEDSNTGFGYLTYANAAENWAYSTGTNDTQCSPYTRWPDYPHRPFFEAQDPNGGFPGEQKHDIGLVWAAGAGGQKLSVHRGLDLVIAVRDDSVSVGESEPVGAFEGHKNVWNAIRPALVALDPVHQGDEEAFCAAYQASEYAPDLLEPWFQPARSAPPAETSQRSRCLARRVKIGPRNIGRLRLGQSRTRTASRAKPLGRVTRRTRVLRYCVRGGNRRARGVAVFDGRGKLRLAATSGRGHRRRGITPGTARRKALRRFGARRVRRLGRGVNLVRGPRRSRSRVVLGIRAGKVRYVAVADRALARKPHVLRRYALRARLR